MPPAAQVAAWIAQFESALARGEISALPELFDEHCYWRDLLPFTWNIRTLEGRDAIYAMLNARLAIVRPHAWRVDGQATLTDGGVEAFLTFQTAVARGIGHVRLRNGRAVTLLTAMSELKGHEERRGGTREIGAEHGAIRGRTTWLDRRTREQAELGHARQPYVVIVGGGQGGIGLGARLKMLGVPTIILEANPRPGDSWRRRYASLCLHDPVWYDHLPYIPFPDHWPVFTPKDKMGDWLEMYTKVMELDYWGSSRCTSATWDDAFGHWEIAVERPAGPVVLRPSHLVLATGLAGMPKIPRVPGAERFRGDQHHSSSHPGGAAWAGKRCIVLGAGNSAHDICVDLWEHGAQVTMIQRSPTTVIRSSTIVEQEIGALYSERAVESGIDVDRADLIAASMPYALQPALGVQASQRIQAQDADLYQRLRKAGFMVDFGEDGSGLGMKYLRRGSGYYIDVGASDLIADGRIGLRSGTGLREIRPDRVVLDDGTELPADLIVYATGYGTMDAWAERIVSREVADRIGRCWGLGSGMAGDPGPWEGELRNMWKPTRQPGLWFHGGNLAQSRFHSRFLALQLKARLEGLPTPVYGEPSFCPRD
ncbi:MAG: FAD-dependent oxidoreductase [Gammaproteobacteria bacterium]